MSAPRSSLYRDEAIILRTQKLGEADRIITLLTKEHGRIRGVAKGVRRTMSKFGARLEPGSHVDIQMHAGKTFDTITQSPMPFLKRQSVLHNKSKSQRRRSFN
jgi:DNA repair protein RecO (recombination protein O)